MPRRLRSPRAPIGIDFLKRKSCCLSNIGEPMQQRVHLALWGAVTSLPLALFMAMLFHHEETDGYFVLFIWLAALSLLAGAFTYLLLGFGHFGRKVRSITPLSGAAVALGAYCGVVLTVDGVSSLMTGRSGQFGGLLVIGAYLSWYPLLVGTIIGLAFDSSN